jgi:hypothetical protein
MAAQTIEELIAEFNDRPSTECPPAPPWHVDSHACFHGWIQGGSWILCDCEDPDHPWPARAPGDGPRDCSCFGCMDHQPRWERGKLVACEYKDHHCPDCHEHKRCTICGF